MRKQLSCVLMIAALAFPYNAYATSSADDPTSIGHPAFANLKSQIKTSFDYYPDDPTTGGQSNTKQTISIDDLGDATNPGKITLAKGCNPVVWASLVQRGREKTLHDLAIASGINHQTANAMNNKCTTKLGNNGEDRTDVEQKLRNQIENDLNLLESAICQLDWNALINGFFGVNISICKNGQIFSASTASTFSSTFLLNGQDPFKSKDCLNPGKMNANLMSQTAGSFGTNALNGSNPGSIKFDSSSSVPSGSGGGWSFGIGFGGGGGGNGHRAFAQPATTPPTNPGSKPPTNNGSTTVPPNTPPSTPPNIYK